MKVFNVRFLIDGYNLMHALGMAPKPGGLSLERSRLRFVEWLALELVKRDAEVTIVFDSQHPRGGNETVHRGIQLIFADARTADDHIEEMVRVEKSPAHLTVVSNDHRIQVAASRRACVSWTCAEFVDWLQSATGVRKSVPAIESEKPIEPSSLEMEEWLRRFGA